jgi:valyl-tRNA synthetase
MPFLSEEIWHLIDDREFDIIVSQWPEAKSIDEQLINDFNNTMEVVSGIRNIRKEKNIAKKEELDLFVISDKKANNGFDATIKKLGNLSSINYTSKKVENAFSFMVKANQYFVPLSDNFDKDAEIEKLNKDLNYTTGFLKIVENKLSNKKFVENAPKQLVENEKNKLEDAKEKIRILTQKINSLS